MKDHQGQMRRRAAGALFTDEEVRAIRRADEVGLISRQAQARMYGCGKETIARICRGETYYWVAGEEEAVDGMIARTKRGGDPLYSEPTQDEIEASKRRLAELLRAQGRADELVDELARAGAPSGPLGTTPGSLEADSGPSGDGAGSLEAPPLEAPDVGLSDEQVARLEKLKADPFANVEAARKYI